jgi:hypothetical protein
VFSPWLRILPLSLRVLMDPSLGEFSVCIQLGHLRPVTKLWLFADKLGDARYSLSTLLPNKGMVSCSLNLVKEMENHHQACQAFSYLPVLQWSLPRNWPTVPALLATIWFDIPSRQASFYLQRL